MIVPSGIPSRILTFWQDFELVPLSRDNEGTSVPLSRKVALSHPVGHPNLIYLFDFEAHEEDTQMQEVILKL